MTGAASEGSTGHTAAGQGAAARVDVYGNDHSAWTQAVLLGLHERGLAHTLATVPPLGVFLHSGILMPAARLDRERWILDSAAILAALGFGEVAPADRAALQTVFRTAAMQRVYRPWRFWCRFSQVRDEYPGLVRRRWNQVARAYSVLYFFVLILLGSHARPRPGLAQVASELAYFQDRLPPGQPFLGGAAPDTADLQLFGIVQMCASIPGPSLEALRAHPRLSRLREWIAAMQERYRSYPYLYSGPDFEPRLPPRAPAPTLDRALFWLGAGVVWLAAPLTVPSGLFLAWWIRKRGLQKA